jgi:hypothetical protein
MNVILGPACGQQEDLVVLGHGCKITPKGFGVPDHVNPLLRAKDAMDEDGSVGMRHVYRLDIERSAECDGSHDAVCRPFRDSTNL